MIRTQFQQHVCAKCGHVHTSPIICVICRTLVPAYAALKGKA